VADNIQVAGQADIDHAVTSARAAFKGEWSKWTPAQRSKAMLKFADLIDEHAKDIAQWETKSMGQPINIAVWIVSMISTVYRCKIVQLSVR
jgi:aldehyde dehydrogenase (NAD+)